MCVCMFAKIWFFMVHELFLFMVQGSLMYGVIKKMHVAKFQSHIEEGGVYVISNFKVMRPLGGYQVTDNPLKICFLVITKIRRIEDLSGRIPRYAFQFIDLLTLDARVNNNSFLSGELCGFISYLMYSECS